MTIADPLWPRAGTWLAGDHPDPEILVVGVPWSQGSSPPSQADLAPMALRDRLDRYSTFHGEWSADFSKVRVRDIGNWAISHLDNIEMPAVVGELAGSLPDAAMNLYLGGDNAITRPLIRATHDDLGKVGLIIFDARHGVRPLDSGPTSETSVRGIIEDGLPGENVVQIGIHSFANSADDRSYCNGVGASIVTVEQVEREGIDAVVGSALEALQACDLIYVNVDCAVLDSVYAPGSRGARPGGLAIRQLAEGVRICSRHPRVKAVDFVGVDPNRDRDGLTLDAMAHVFLSAVAGYSES